jgi:hypothetical protein
VLVEDGRIRVFHRHPLRLRRSGARPRQISAVRALAGTWPRTAGRPVLVRFDVAAGEPSAPATCAASLTTADHGVVPVTAIDGRPLGVDPRVERLAAAWTLLR